MTNDNEYGVRVRFLVLAIATTCLTMNYCNVLALNFTIICMNDVTMKFRENETCKNGNQTVHEKHWLESNSKKSMLFSAIALGTLLGTLPFIKAIFVMGPKNTFVFFGLLSAGSTLLLPFFVDQGGFWPTALMRLFQGFALAANFPACGDICERWSKLKQSSFYFAFLSCHVQLAVVVTMSVAGALCASPLGWRSLYYLQGSITLVGWCLFFVFYTDSPAAHSKITPIELSKIQNGKIDEQTTSIVPYMDIIRSKPIIGVWLASVGGNLGFNLFVQYGPIYLNKVLGFEVKSTGYATAIPFVISFITKIFVSPLANAITIISEKWKMIIFACISHGTMALCIVGLALTTDKTLAQIFYTIAIPFSGLNVIGTARCAQLVARHHIHFVMTVFSFINFLIILLIPIGVTLVAPDNTHKQWSTIWYSIVVIIIITTTYFSFVADAEPANWTKINYGNKKKSIDCYIALGKPLGEMEERKPSVQIIRLNSILNAQQPTVRSEK